MSDSSLSAAVVAAVENLELAARLVVEGTRAGPHRSPFHGFSAEFQQHRPYRPGDDLRHLDWKLLARTDRLYSRQFRDTTNLSLMLVLDTSGSMAFPAEGVSRFRYGQLLAAALAHLAITGGDSAGLMATTPDGAFEHLPARAGRTHLRSLVARIDGLAPDGEWRGPEAISRGAELLRRRGVMIVISDFYDREEETRLALRRVARRGHDLVMLQLTSPEETDFPYAGEIEFEDLESGGRRLVHAGTSGERYREAVRDFQRRCREGALRDGIDHALISTAEAPATALRSILLRRAAHEARRRGGPSPSGRKAGR